MDSNTESLVLNWIRANRGTNNIKTIDAVFDNLYGDVKHDHQTQHYNDFLFRFLENEHYQRIHGKDQKNRHEVSVGNRFCNRNIVTDSISCLNDITNHENGIRNALKRDFSHEINVEMVLVKNLLHDITTNQVSTIRHILTSD